MRNEKQIKIAHNIGRGILIFFMFFILIFCFVKDRPTEQDKIRWEKLKNFRGKTTVSNKVTKINESVISFKQKTENSSYKLNSMYISENTRIFFDVDPSKENWILYKYKIYHGDIIEYKMCLEIHLHSEEELEEVYDY